MAVVLANGGEDAALQYLTNKDSTPEDLTLKLYTNNYTPIETSVNTSFTEASGSGYSANLLTASSWTVTPGNPSVASYPQVTWTFTGALGNVYGYFVVRRTSNDLMWAERFTDGPYNVAASGDVINVTLQVSLS